MRNPSHAQAAERFDPVDGPHTWPALDVVEADLVEHGLRVGAHIGTAIVYGSNAVRGTIDPELAPYTAIPWWPLSI